MNSGRLEWRAEAGEKKNIAGGLSEWVGTPAGVVVRVAAVRWSEEACLALYWRVDSIWGCRRV